MSALILLPCTLLTQGIYAGIISAISGITVKTCGLINSIYRHKYPDVNSTIIELDIECQLRIIHSVLNKIQDNKHNKNNTTREIVELNDLDKTRIFELVKLNPDKDVDDPIELCLTYLRESVENIHLNLANINNKIEYHNTKWFNYWRTLNIKNYVEQLKMHTRLLNERLDRLIKISSFLHQNN
ncbi:hypothetical protein QJ854_gp229 [Moumouvirus goulette]|uniref:Uncharacterized protein n=2 Tax=Moumouvirus TaxID=3080801 RepID=M1PHJ3_9VIRU|nr:hypothetical protein QJ854_gp229 [Moumouvirus goulette]AGF85553.1 hypothetical protein glt_00748 [Moumouvirus goulette]